LGSRSEGSSCQRQNPKESPTMRIESQKKE
jgi:hypothetical protein